MANIRKRPSGSYQVQIRLPGLKPICKTFKTKTLATKFAREVEGDTQLQQALGKPIIEKITFKEVVELYVKQYTGKDPSNIGRLNWWCEQFGNMAIISIDEFMIDDGLIKKSKTASGSTCNRYKATVSSVFQFFIKHPLYKRLQIVNPVRGASVTTFKENDAKERFLNQDEQQRLLISCKNTDWKKMYLLVLMALTTGARRGDLLKLKWSDIDFSLRQAKLARGETKNEQPRIMPLTLAVVKELLKFREKGNGLIFNNSIKDSGVPMDYRKSLDKAMKEADIDDCRFHDMRHSCASNLAMNGATLQEIADVLGHKNIQMTMRYAHLLTEHKADLINRVMGNLG